MARRRTTVGKGPTLTPGATQSRVSPSALPQTPTLPARSPPVRAEGVSQSKYEVEQVQPPNLISDVGTNNWWSPFQPIAPFGPPTTTFLREWDYPAGHNLDIAPARLRYFARLRAMSQSWGVLRTIIETRKDQLLACPWDLQIRGKPLAQNPRIDELREFFRRPDGKRRFNPWARMLLEDLFVIDAPTLNVGYRDMQGRPLICEVVDGATIKVLIDDAGRIPDYPNPAYQQIIKGLPMTNYDETDLIYAPMRPRPEMPIYGYSPVEHIETELTEAIRKTHYQLGFWVEGSLPDMIMSVPKEWTPTQIASYQALFDSTLSGNLAEKSKVRFVPEGMKPYDIKNSGGEGLSSNRDEVLIRLACYAFSVSPSPFIKAMNRATAESAAQESQQEGLHPLMTWFRDDIMNRIVQDEFGYDDAEFVWLPQSETDQLKRSQVYMNLVKNALLSPNEARQDMGRQPVPDGDSLLVFTTNSVMTLADAIAAGKALAAATLAGATGGDGATPGGGSTAPATSSGKDDPADNSPRSPSIAGQDNLEEVALPALGKNALVSAVWDAY